MSDTVFYEGNEHVFYNENGSQNVYLKAGMGQTLIVESTTLPSGPYRSIQYNNNGLLGGSSDLNYDGVYLTSPSIKTPSVNGCTNSDLVGYNEIFNGIAPQNCITSQSTSYHSLGVDVSMARNTNEVAYACPFYPFFNEAPHLGGMSVWKESAGTFNEYTTSILSYSNYTLNANVRFCSINENGTIAVLTDGSEFAYQTTYTKSGSTWSSANFSTEFVGIKLSNLRMLSYDMSSNFRTHNWNGSAWILEANLLTNGLSPGTYFDYNMAIDNDRLAFSYGSNTFLYSLISGNWTLITTIPIAALSLDYYNNVLSLLTSTKLRIYEAGVLTFSLNIFNGNRTCTNGNYVFYNTALGEVVIFHKIGSVWTQSTNQTFLALCDKMSCNANYLAIGTPSFNNLVTGSASIYKITPYTSAGIIVNTINLLNAGKIQVDAPSGTLFNTGQVYISDVTDSSSTTSGSVRISGGLGISKTIYATTFSSPNNAFKFSNYQASTAQSVSGSVSSSILFGTNIIQGISTLTKSLSAGGSRFTTSIACKLLVSWHFRSTGASNFGQTYILVNGTGRFLGHCNAWAQPGQGNALSSATILNLSANDFFSTFALFDNTCNISSEGTYQVSTIEIYSLN